MAESATKRPDSASVPLGIGGAMPMSCGHALLTARLRKHANALAVLAPRAGSGALVGTAARAP